MAIKEMEVNGNVYTFVADSRNTRNGFAHDCTLYKNFDKVNEATCHYLNRTWECYQYQSVMRSAIYNVMDREKDILKSTFKAEKGYKNLTEKRKAEFDSYLVNSDNAKNYREYVKVYESL